MNIKKKQTTSPPARYTVKESHQSPRNAPQEAIISATSIQNHIEDEPTYTQTGKFNTYEKRSGNQIQSRSPQFVLIYVEQHSIVQEEPVEGIMLLSLITIHLQTKKS